MQAALHPGRAPVTVREDDPSRLLPLYVASLLVTLAGIGAVGVTVNYPAWTAFWSLMAIGGHAVSFWLRRTRIPAELVFFPVMIFTLTCLTLQVSGQIQLPGLEGGLGLSDAAMATALVVGMLAGARCFALLGNRSLLFSPVPSLTMLALVGSANPNPEVPVFFGLLVLGSLFLLGYEAHLRRVERTRREPSLVPHLLVCWAVLLIVALGALLFPFALQPLLARFSPYWNAVARMRNLTSFSPTPMSNTPVGAGPIRLSPQPVYVVRTPESGRVRTHVYSHYSGRDWQADPRPTSTALQSYDQSDEDLPGRFTSYDAYLFDLGADPEVTVPVRKREVPQRFETVGFTSQGIPGMARIRRLRYPSPVVTVWGNGVVTGSSHNSYGRSFEVVSEVVEPTLEQLRAAPLVDPATFWEPENLDYPSGAGEVAALGRRIASEFRNPYDRVRAIIQYIEKHCEYTLFEEVTPPGEDAAAYYLFRTRRGACDLAATAATIMCRGAGVPTRVAVGYVLEEPLDSGDGYLVRQEHAHMWIESYFPGLGWIAFDAAPPVNEIRENYFSLALAQIRGLFSKVGGGGMDAILLLFVLLVTAALVSWRVGKIVRSSLREAARRRRVLASDPSSALAMLYVQALELFQRRGWGKEPSETPREFLARAREWDNGDSSLADLLHEFLERYERARYGGRAEEADVAAARAELEAFRRRLPRRPRPRRRSVPAPAAAS